MTGRLSDEVRLRHIINAIEEIEGYIENLDYSDFVTNSMLRNASIKLLEIIGEAAKHLSDALKNKYSSINWMDISDFRNILVHEYFAVDYSMIWDIILNEIPGLKLAVTNILKEEFNNQ